MMQRIPHRLRRSLRRKKHEKNQEKNAFCACAYYQIKESLSSASIYHNSTKRRTCQFTWPNINSCLMAAGTQDPMVRCRSHASACLAFDLTSSITGTSQSLILKIMIHYSCLYVNPKYDCPILYILFICPVHRMATSVCHLCPFSSKAICPLILPYTMGIWKLLSPAFQNHEIFIQHPKSSQILTCPCFQLI